MPIKLVGNQIRWGIPKKYRLYYNFRVHDVGRRGHLQRLAARRKATGEWQTVGWRINLASYRTWAEIQAAIKRHVPTKDRPKALKLARKWWKEKHHDRTA